jgi:hypothetical protein
VYPIRPRSRTHTAQRRLMVVDGRSMPLGTLSFRCYRTAETPPPSAAAMATAMANSSPFRFPQQVRAVLNRSRMRHRPAAQPAGREHYRLRQLGTDDVKQVS